jgi:hypothetical protein
LLRGTRGGRYYFDADPDDPASWHGDHFAMTLRRRLFEAHHKTAISQAFSPSTADDTMAHQLAQKIA